MNDEERLEQLLEDLVLNDRTPEEACRDTPELLPLVRERLRRMRNVQADVDILFPPMTSSASPRAARSFDSPADLPSIQGYDVLEVLGRGGAGVVYKAWHVRLHREVALKMLLAGEFALPQELARFSREAEVVAGLNHPNIVQIHDVGDHGGRPYFTMEYVEGGNLAKRLAGTPLPAPEAAELVAVLAEAMHTAHQSGIVHRDLKPANILLTPAGVPKITDFGLARRIQGGTELTLSGATLGTPSYMAPEQAQGDARAIGPAVDVYALGAILYELLTGRPPFRAETPLETQLQVVTQEPVTPSRLNRKAPRDLETISLECLHKDPSRRYASALSLAEDLRRFQRGEPIRARPVGAGERTAKWIRRRPAQAALILGVALLTLALFAYGVWKGMERAATVSAVESQLADVVRSEQRADWADARAKLQLARFQLGTGGSTDLRSRLDRAGIELASVERLDGIRMSRAALDEGQYDSSANAAHAAHDFDETFRAAGIGTPDEEPAKVAARIQASGIRVQLVGALDEWSTSTQDANRLAWITAVARASDPDPSGWRDRARDPSVWKDKAALTELATSANVTTQSVPILLALRRRLEKVGGDPIPMLRRMYQEHPDDYWLNFALGDVLRYEHPGESARYFQATLAVRPDSAVAYNNLATSLAASGRTEEAHALLRRAIEIEPALASAHENLGNCLSLEGRNDDAVAEYRVALGYRPDFVSAHQNLGRVLAVMGDREGAIAEFEKVLEMDPSHASAHASLCTVMMDLRRLDEAIEHGETALKLDPNLVAGQVNLGLALATKGRTKSALEHLTRALEIEPHAGDAHRALGSVLIRLGRFDEARAHLETAVRIDPNDSAAHNGLGNVLEVQGPLRAAIAEFRESIRLAPKDARGWFNLGLCLHGAREFDEAVACFEKAFELDERLSQAHAAIGRTRLAQGRFVEAKAAMQRCIDRQDPADPNRDEALSLLGRCETLIALDARADAVRAGTDVPTDAEEMLKLADLFHCKQEHVIAATLSARAFAAEPELAQDARQSRRYNAACDAALAGTGQGADAASASTAERARWRAQARAWLQSDVDSFAEILEGDPHGFGPRLERGLSHWRVDADLAGLRDEDAIKALSAAERQQCRELWSQVELLLQHTRDVR